MSTSKTPPTKPTPSRQPSSRPPASRPAATGSRPPAKAAPASRSSAPKPTASRAPAPLSSGAGQSAMRNEGGGNSLQRQRAIFVGSLVIIVAVFMVLGVRSARHDHGNTAAANTATANTAAGNNSSSTPAVVDTNTTATLPAAANAASPPIVDGGADIVPITIWLDPERKAIVVASKDHTIKAESGSNGNPVEPDADRPTRSLVSFKHWEAAAKQLESGAAELVCRTVPLSSTTDRSETSGQVFHSEKDDAGHVKLSVAELPPAREYVLEFRKKGATEGPQLARFSFESRTTPVDAESESAGGESGASNDNTATASDSTDAGSDNNVQR